MAPRHQSAIPTAAALLALFVFALSANTLPAALVRAAADFGTTTDALAKVFSVQFACFFVSTVVGGILSDILGKQRVMQVACLLMFAGAVTWTQAASGATACLAGALLGMAGGVLEGMSSALLSDLYPHRRKFYLNLSQVVYCLGAVTGPALMGALLIRGVSWRDFFGALAVLSGLLLLLFSASRIPPPAHDEKIDPARLQAIGRRPAFLLPCAVIFLYVTSETCVVVFINPYLKEGLAAPENWAIYGLSIFWLAMTLGRWICAHIPERVPNHRVIALLSLLSAGSLVAQLWADTWPMSLCLFGLTGFLFAGTWPLIVGMTASRNRGHSGTVIGVTVAVGSLGCVVGPIYMGIARQVMSPTAAFATASIPLLLAALLVLLPVRYAD